MMADHPGSTNNSEKKAHVANLNQAEPLFTHVVAVDIQNQTVTRRTDTLTTLYIHF